MSSRERSATPSKPPANRPARRPRRTDPDRRDRIIDATLDVIAAHGVADTTYRRVAEAADVAPSSLNYHFTDLDVLLCEAFRRLATQVGERYDALLAAAGTREEAVQAVTDIITGRVWSSPRTLLLSYELYTYASRRPEAAAVALGWMRLSRQALERHFDPTTARALDALIEGLGIHAGFDAQALPRADIERVVRAVAMLDGRGASAR